MATKRAHSKAASQSPGDKKRHLDSKNSTMPVRSPNMFDSDLVADVVFLGPPNL